MQKTKERFILLLIIASSVIQASKWQTYTNFGFIYDICGNDSNLFLATAGGVVILQTKPEPEVKKVLLHTDGLGVNKCLGIAQDSEGNLWVATYGAGVVVIGKDLSEVRRYSLYELPQRTRVVAVAGSRVILGTEQGLFVIETQGTPLDFSDDRIRRFTVGETKELLSDQVLAIGVIDSCCWIGTNQGVSCADTSFSRWQGFRRPLGDSVLAIGFLKKKVILATEAGLAIGERSGFLPLWQFPSVKKVKDIAVYDNFIYLATVDTVFKVDTTGAAQPFFIKAAQSLWVQETFWVGGGGSEEAGQGLFYLQSGQSWRQVALGCIYSGLISDCTFGKDGSVYLGHHSNSVTRLLPDDGSIQIIRSPLSWALQIRCDSKGRLWFSHFWPGGVSMFDPATNSWQSITWSGKKNIIMAFGLDRFDTKWVFNQNGSIIAIDSTGRQAEFVLPELVPPPGGGYEFAFDSKNRVWLGLTNGLEEFDYGGTLFDPSDDGHTLHIAGLPSTEIRSIAVDFSDNVWVATPQGGAVWNGKEFQVYTTANSPLLSNDLYRVRVDDAGRVWFLSDLGLSIFDVAIRRWTNYTPQNSGILPNPQGLSAFYTALDLDVYQGLAGIGTTRGFSLFNFATPYDTQTARLRVYPNPFITKEHSGVIIDGLPKDAQVRVYTISGKLVAVLPVMPGTGRAVWYPNKTTNGLYIIVATSGMGSYTEKVAVIQKQ